MQIEIEGARNFEAQPAQSGLAPAEPGPRYARLGSLGEEHSRHSENPENQLGGQRRIRSGLGRGNENREHGVDGRSKKHGRHHNEEILHDEVVHAIRRDLC